MARLLRDGEAHVADGRDAVDVDVRLMAGAEASPDTWVADGHLRGDLYERLAALRIFFDHVPPLRRRREDIPPLAVHFLRSACAGAGVPVKGLSRSAMTPSLGLAVARQRARPAGRSSRR